MALWSDEDVEAESRKLRVRSESAGVALPRILTLVALFLVLVISAGTIYGFASGTRQKKLERESDRAQVAADLAGRSAYTAIGTVRAKSADPKPAVVVATIAFPYDAEDEGFAEELGRKSGLLKTVAVSVLSAKKASELAPAYEGGLKAALRDAFNARLSLGKVTEIWLSDFAVIQ
jgi:flagellar basal body-associated protein FliL